MNKPNPNPHHDDPPQRDDRKREEQRSHGDQQNRSKKDGHVAQVGSGQDQTSARPQGGGARRQP